MVAIITWMISNQDDHIKVIMLDDNPIIDKESLIKLNTVLRFNGSNIPKNI